MTAVVRYDNGRFDIFTGTQSQTRAIAGLVEGLKVDASRIRLHQHYLGGGFGRNHEWDIDLEAALIAREAPVAVDAGDEDRQQGRGACLGRKPPLRAAQERHRRQRDLPRLRGEPAHFLGGAGQRATTFA